MSERPGQPDEEQGPDGDPDVEPPPPPRPGHSVFAEPAGHPDDSAGDEADHTVPFPTVGITADPESATGSARPVLDGAVFGVYEDERPSGRLPAVIATLLVLATLGVGLLVWRAVHTDADLELPEQASTTTSTTITSVAPPTIEDLQAIVPPSIESCIPPPEEPADDPTRVVLRCPLDGVPESMELTLFGSLADRDAAFDTVVSEMGASPGAECALGRFGVHDYIGVERVGRVACQSGEGRVDFVWTSDQAPLLLRAGGGGAFVDHYRFWARLVDRADASFPLPVERDLLDRLPEAARTGCTRDLGLDVDAPGVAAVRCEPGAPPSAVSSVQFAAGPTMEAWIERYRGLLRDNVFDQTGAGCTSTGFGRLPAVATTTTTTTTTTTAPADSTSTTSTTSTTAAPVAEEPPPPQPDAAVMPYDLDGTTGTILCFVNSNRQNVLFWTREDSLVGSIAVSDATLGATMRELLAWWEAGGHRP